MTSQSSIPRLVESPISDEQREGIEELAIDAAEYLQVDQANQTTREILERIENRIRQLQTKQVQPIQGEEMDLFLGSLWGSQLVRALAWEWVEVTFLDSDNAKAIGVFSPDRSLGIYPFHYLYGCLEHTVEPCLVIAFDQITSTVNQPKPTARHYQNLMSQFS
jgi:hypothetical protein